MQSTYKSDQAQAQLNKEWKFGILTFNNIDGHNSFLFKNYIKGLVF